MDGSSTIVNFQDKNNRKVVSLNAIKYKKSVKAAWTDPTLFSTLTNVVGTQKNPLNEHLKHMLKFGWGEGEIIITKQGPNMKPQTWSYIQF